MTNQGNLSSAIHDLLENKRDKKCILGKLLDDLKDPDLEAMNTLLASTVSHAKIADLLNSNGIVIGETAIWKHRTKRCPCVRPS